MKTYLQQYRPFLMFLGKFLLSYLILIVLYQSYLSQFDASRFEVDGFTYIVADHSGLILDVIGYTAVLSPYLGDASILVTISGDPIVRIIEGCNAISIMILFAAFIIAFSRKFVPTLAYILVGILLIHLLNVLRIAFLCIGIIHYPEYEHFLHGVLFPLVIYGFVFVLWVVWVRKFKTNV